MCLENIISQLATVLWLLTAIVTLVEAGRAIPLVSHLGGKDLLVANNRFVELGFGGCIVLLAVEPWAAGLRSMDY